MRSCLQRLLTYYFGSAALPKTPDQPIWPIHSSLLARCNHNILKSPRAVDVENNEGVGACSLSWAKQSYGVKGTTQSFGRDSSPATHPEKLVQQQKLPMDLCRLLEDLAEKLPTSQVSGIFQEGFMTEVEETGGIGASSAYEECENVKGLQPELFFKIFIGKVAADHSHKWVFKEPQDQEINFLSTWNNPADSTIALVAVREGVVQLGSVNKVVEDLSFIVLLRKKFSYLESIPGVLLPHPSSSSSSAAAAFPIVDGCNMAAAGLHWTPAPPPPFPTPEFYDQYLATQQMRIAPSMSSLEALLSKLPPVAPPPGFMEMPPPAVPAKEEDLEEEMETLQQQQQQSLQGGDHGESSRSLPSYYLNQLFHQHDSGLDQAFIDALPVFLYTDLAGSKEEPFDCAVCLCEFDAAAGDELRLLPACGHAFHLSCIDTWLLSNSTCPLCRASLSQGPPVEDVAFDSSDQTQDDEEAAGEPHEPAVEETAAEKKAFPVRLGKFRNLDDGASVNGEESGRTLMGNWRLEEGESSSSSLDARRCFSMGSYQYVVADAELHVAFKNCCASASRGREAKAPGCAVDESAEGKRLGVGGRRESFSVSKIWLWSNKKGKVAVPPPDASDLEANLPWKKTTAIGDA
ncbi:hypothetical protein ZIOFF_021432 [Zingiber officinale]|uniref:RING-type E3 ubiquitin transferase n=1 Tax=Zingiber officinale TaxID=94328 RepID=A0A8J5HK27_ZINOF|nr:hypothetical protein ZIOFF_021432 [Zingiber officinale]